MGNSADDTRSDTAEYLGIPRDEVDWITDELLAETPVDVDSLNPAELEGDESADGDVAAAVVPNRIWYISEIARGWSGDRWNITFYRNCDRSVRYVMWGERIDRWERDGTCGIGGGRYVYRYKLWWREG